MAKRTVRIDLRWTPQEVAQMDRYRGRMSRTAWLERAHRLAVQEARDLEAQRSLLALMEPDG